MSATASDADRDGLVAASLDVLETAIRGFYEYERRVGEGPYDRSALSDFERETKRTFGPNGRWSDDFGERLTNRAAVYLAGSRNYLASIYYLVKNYPHSPGVAPLARCVAEACGKMAWLLDNRLGTKSHARERVARLLLDEADDASRRKSLAVGLRHPERAVAGDEYRKARDAVATPGYFWAGEIDLDRSGVPTVRGQRLPKTSDFVVIAEKILSQDSRDARHVYGYLSALTHPTMFAYLESMAAQDVVFCAKVVNYAVLAFHNEMRLHSGWTQPDPSYLPEGDPIREKHDALNVLIGSHTVAG